MRPDPVPVWRNEKGALPLVGTVRPGVPSLEWGRPWYDGLTQFFDAAARADDAMFVWLD
ncbi:hypothetical protein GCM10010309_42940 [Streptomyces violaceochromogenes]|nr:hypothetical protein GCM10010309_42940 [Streptomyces violaceochromogenes]